jgi:hypothetical protein
MKKLTLAALLAATSLMSYAQVPVTSGLQLHLDAASGFSDNGAAAATWTDLSPGGSNSMAATSNAVEPIYTTNVAGSGYDGLYFNGTSQYMVNTINSTMSNTEGSIFVVRIADPHSADDAANGLQCIVSVAEDNCWINEMALCSDWVQHHSSSGNWKHLRHQCYNNVPTDRPAILSGIYGIDEADIDFVINDIHSTQSIYTQSGPWDYSVVDRGIIIGARHDSNTPSSVIGSYWEGYIFEVLIYDRKLSASEQKDVNDYLKCKYNINYSSQMCNDPQYACDPCFRSTNLDVVQTGYDDRGNCTFTATATANPASGVTILGYRWTIPGMPDFVVITGATSDVQNFTLPVPSGGAVSVTVYAVKSQWGVDESPCCEWRDDKQVECMDGKGNGKATNIIGSNEDPTGFSIYPNPTDKNINILNTKGVGYKVSVTDFTGRVIISGELTNGRSNKLSLEGKPAGVYMVQLVDGTGNTLKTEKLILK